jgi:hypothetical protein
MSERNPHVLNTKKEWSTTEWRRVHKEYTLSRPNMLIVVQINKDKINGAYA